MKSILKYILLTAIRDRLYVGIFIILLGALGISTVVGGTALVEQAQATMVYVAGSSRMIFTIGMILFVCFYVRRSFENREVEFVLSKPISRHTFVFAYLIGFTLVALLMILPLVVLLFFMKANPLGLFYWGISLLFESLIMITFSLLSALILRSAVSAVMASLGFYVISRMMGFFVLTIQIPEKITDLSTSDRFLKAVLKIISIVFPRLDLYGKSEWLLYGTINYSDIFVIFGQSFIYIPLMIFMTFYDFNRKQF